MTRPLVMLALALTLLLTGAVWLARAQPAHPPLAQALLDELRQCETPCVMGIEPGVSELPFVNETLRAHGWVGGARFSRAMALSSGYMQWDWSGVQPGYFVTEREGGMWIENGMTHYMAIATTLTIGDWWLALGPPSSALWQAIFVEPPKRAVTMWWADAGVQLRFEILCGADAWDWWHARTILVLDHQGLRASPRSAALWLPCR
jgi:hypothetical protein